MQNPSDIATLIIEGVIAMMLTGIPWYLERRKRLAEARKIEAEGKKVETDATGTIVKASQDFVQTGASLVGMLESRLKSLDDDYQETKKRLQETNVLYNRAMEELTSLSQRLGSLREEVTKLTNLNLAYQQENTNLRKRLDWALRHLRRLWRMGGPRMFMDGIVLPEEKDMESWIARAEFLDSD